MTHPTHVGIVVGAGDALGSAIARRFAREGYTMAVARRTRDKLDTRVDEIARAGGRALPYALDARREEQVADFFGRVVSDAGVPDVVVFNVGGNVGFSLLEPT